MDSYDDIDLIKLFDAIRDDYIPKTLAALAPLTLKYASVYSFEIPPATDKPTISFVPVNAVNITNTVQAVAALGKHLSPHTRTDSMPYPPRLVGVLQFDGEKKELKLAQDAIANLNNAKQRFGDSLKTLYPKMHKRTAFIKRHLNAISTRSIHRQLHCVDSACTSTSLIWADKHKRTVFCELEDVRSILAGHYYKFSPDKQNEKMAIVHKRMSNSPCHQLVLKVAERVHPVQYVSIKSNQQSKRSNMRPGLPLIVLGGQDLKPTSLSDYQVDVDETASTTLRYNYASILPEIGLYQRKLTDKEWAKKCKQQKDERHA